MAQRWCIIRDKKRGVRVRRWNNGKYENLTKTKYQGLSEEELEKYVKRLNAPIDNLEKVQFKHAFIDDFLIENYREWLSSRVPTESEVKREITAVKEHFLEFFISKLDLPNPADWYKSQERWSTYLIGHKELRSVQSKRRVIQAANRFIGWLQSKRPDEFQLMKFEPISRAVFKKIQASRELNKEIKERKLITDEDWNVIKKALSNEIAPFCYLSYHYGLRRSESMGLKPGDTKNTYLLVERQLSKIGSYRPLKGREARKVPHWFSTPTKCYTWIEQASKIQLHPDTLTDRWKQLMVNLSMNYDFHDLRHTFITKAMRKQAPRDVQMAAGHKNITTTMGYLHDDRNMEDEEFIPEAG